MLSSKQKKKNGIKAAKKALINLKTGSPISTNTLRDLSRSMKEPLDFYENRKGVAAFQILELSTEQRDLAILALEDFIDDNIIELSSENV